MIDNGFVTAPTAPQQGGHRLGPDSLLIAVILTIMLVTLAWGERVGVGEGLGWDGQIYASWARDPRGTVFGPEGLDSYYVQRFLPSLAVHFGLSVSGAELSNRNIIAGFSLLNTAMNVASIWVVRHIAGLLGLGLYGRCLAIIALFANFFFLKTSIYYPVLTDDSAFLIGLLQFLFFLRGQTLVLLLTTAAGAFLWPTALPVGLILAMFPRSEEIEPEATPSSRRAATAAAALASAGFLAGIALLYYLGRLSAAKLGCAGPLMQALPLSAAFAAGTLAAALIPLLDDRRLYSPRLILRSLSRRGLLLAGCTAVAIKLLQRYLTDPSIHSPFGLKFRLWITMSTAVAKPGIALLSHVVYWGPALLLIVFYWGTVCRAIHRMGIGLTLVALATLLLAVCSESRQLSNILPMVVLVGIKAIEDRIPARAVCWLLAPASLFASRFWYRINVAPFRENPLEYPDQRYFMSLGPWMASPWYFIQLALAVGFGVVLYVVCSRGAGAEASVATGRLAEEIPA